MKITVALAALAMVAAPAVAQGPQPGSWQVGNDSFHIYYTDLDMNSVAGRAQLLVRVQKATARLCRDDVQAEEQRCLADTVANLHNRDIQRALADREAVQLAAK